MNVLVMWQKCDALRLEVRLQPWQKSSILNEFGQRFLISLGHVNSLEVSLVYFCCLLSYLSIGF